MTTETRPWLQDEGADPSVRELLESTEFDGPSDRQLEKLTARVAFLFDLPPGGGEGGGGGGGGGPSGPAAPAGGAATVAATSGVVKAIVAAGVISVGAVVATVTLREPAAPPVPVVVAPPPVVAKAAPVPEPEPEPIVEPAKPPPPPVVRPTVVRAAPPPPPTETRPSPPPPAPDAELTQLDDAIAAARAGRPAEALKAVEAHAVSWPDSPLAQEREVIAIEALLSLGRRDDARSRLATFRSKWPTSTHLVRLESMLPQ